MLRFSDCTMSTIDQRERVRFMCRIRLPSMVKFGIIDRNERMCWRRDTKQLLL